VDLHMICPLFGGPANRMGPVALRPRLTLGLLLSTSEARQRGQPSPTGVGVHHPFGGPRPGQPAL
jgi:hypothetical protein